VLCDGVRLDRACFLLYTKPLTCCAMGTRGTLLFPLIGRRGLTAGFCVGAGICMPSIDPWLMSMPSIAPCCFAAAS
jgi:hypothetical protein